MPPDLRPSFGYRGWLLACLTPWWFFFGAHAAWSGTELSEGTPLEVVPGPTRALLWILTTTLGIIWARHPSTHPKATWALALMPTARVFSYLIQAVLVALMETTGWDPTPWNDLPYGWWGWAHSVMIYVGMLAALRHVAKEPATWVIRADHRV